MIFYHFFISRYQILKKLIKWKIKGMIYNKNTVFRIKQARFQFMEKRREP